MIIQVTFIDPKKCLSTAMIGRSEQRIIDGSLGRTKYLEVNFPKFILMVFKSTIPTDHQ